MTYNFLDINLQNKYRSLSGLDKHKIGHFRSVVILNRFLFLVLCKHAKLLEIWFKNVISIVSILDHILNCFGSIGSHILFGFLTPPEEWSADIVNKASLSANSMFWGTLLWQSAPAAAQKEIMDFHQSVRRKE